MSGLVRAIVTDNCDPMKLGRIRVRYPFRSGAGANQESEWAKIARDLAHRESGSWMLPEIGDEVIVGFLQGQPDKPVVVGSTYGDEVPPPKLGRPGDFNSDNKNNLVFSKSKAGHHILMDDTPNDRRLLLQDPIGQKMEFKTDKKEITIEMPSGTRIFISDESKKVSIEHFSGHQIAMTEDGISVKAKTGDSFEMKDGMVALSTTSGNKLSLSSDALSLQTSSGQKIEGKGSKLSVSSSGSVVVDGAAKIELGAGAAEALVKGTSFMALFNAHTHSTPDGMSAPPVTPMTPAQLSMKVFTA